MIECQPCNRSYLSTIDPVAHEFAALAGTQFCTGETCVFGPGFRFRGNERSALCHLSPLLRPEN